MITLTPALILTLLSPQAGVQGVPFKAVPSGVILSGVNDNGPLVALMAAAEKVKSLRHFEKFDNDLLCSKQGEMAFVFVRKTYPAYQKLRFRKHVLDLLVRVGVNKPFDYQELATPEFEPFIRAMWRNTPQIVPRPNTKLTFLVTLQTGTIIGSNSLRFNFAPSVRLSEDAVATLRNSPADVLKSKNDIAERLKTLTSLDVQSQYKLLIDSPVNHEVNLVKEALENFRMYYDQENSVLDSKVETILSDPIWADTKARRKIRDMRELKEKLPSAFKLMLNIRKEELSYVDQVPSNEETLALQEAPLTHQYMIEIIGIADGKKFDINLPI
jgi:hypothetical protein